MCRAKLVWVCVSLPLIQTLCVLGAATDGLINLENVAGKLVFYQKEGNATFLRSRGELASVIPTEAMFQLFDPMHTLRAASFSYLWDFGNGEVIEGSEPVVRYNYAASGNYTLRLRVGATKVTKPATMLTGVYTTDVTVLDPIKNIKLTGPNSYLVSQNHSLAVHVDGSPPMWVCWRFLPHCVSDAVAGCRLTMLFENTLRLNHTFTSTGLHCLDISARNDISKLQTSHSLFIRKNPLHNLVFILPCGAILAATFSFIGVVACRPRFAKSKMAASSNAAYSKLELQARRDSSGSSSSHPSIPSAEKGERWPLLAQNGTRL